MSIHTILSQEMEKMDSQLEELFNLAGFAILAYLKKEITEEERNALLADWNTEAQKHYRSFATRIVEEVGKELIEELKVRHDEHICSGCGEGFSCDYEDVYEEIRTKLQKMKGDL